VGWSKSSKEEKENFLWYYMRRTEKNGKKEPRPSRNGAGEWVPLLRSMRGIKQKLLRARAFKKGGETGKDVQKKAEMTHLGDKWSEEIEGRGA